MRVAENPHDASASVAHATWGLRAGCRLLVLTPETPDADTSKNERTRHKDQRTGSALRAAIGRAYGTGRYLRDAFAAPAGRSYRQLLQRRDRSCIVATRVAADAFCKRVSRATSTPAPAAGSRQPGLRDSNRAPELAGDLAMLCHDALHEMNQTPDRRREKPLWRATLGKVAGGLCRASWLGSLKNQRSASACCAPSPNSELDRVTSIVVPLSVERLSVELLVDAFPK
jgi:hypothetical protein